MEGGALSEVAPVPGEPGLWDVALAPASRAAVTVTLPPSGPCDAEGALCTADGRALRETAEARIPGPRPVTVEMFDHPERHDGSEFRLRVYFSGHIATTRKAMREDVFAVSGGTIRDVRRVRSSMNNKWFVTIRPRSEGPVRIELPGTRSSSRSRSTRTPWATATRRCATRR